MTQFIERWHVTLGVSGLMVGLAMVVIVSLGPMRKVDPTAAVVFVAIPAMWLRGDLVHGEWWVLGGAAALSSTRWSERDGGRIDQWAIGMVLLAAVGLWATVPDTENSLLVGAILVGPDDRQEDRRRVDYRYSCSTVTLYLGVKGMDLREHGFGSHNVWRYPHDDIGRMYADQLERHDLSKPWLFMATPSLHSDEPGTCPPGHQILEIATACDHRRFAELRRRDRRAYNLEKKRIRDRILEIVDSELAPGLRDHLALRLTGTPATNERFCRAPAGNAYGAALTPENVTLARRPYRTSVDNLWLANATAGMPSVAGAIGAGARLFRELS